MANLFARLERTIHHQWIALRDPAERIFSPALRKRLAQHVAASETTHTGQIRIYTESGLPLSYLWRNASSRKRAISIFGKQRVWDTEQNNGVLIYLLLADHAIELVADRGLNRHIQPQVWSDIAKRMGHALAGNQWEQGLCHAVDEVTALLQVHFPATAQEPGSNELEDAPVVR